MDYAKRIQGLQKQIPVVRFVPSDMEAYGVGRQQWSQQERQPLHVPWLPPGTLENTLVITNANWEPVMREAHMMHEREAGTLHQAMRDFIAWIKEDYHRPHLGRITDYGQNKIRQVETLMSRHDDMPLRKLDLEQVERMVRYWRQRPSKKDSEDRISVKSSTNYIGELRRFFAWIHRSPRYPWRKPNDFDDIDLTVDRDHHDLQRRLTQEKIFTLNELILLNRYATPLERVFLLLGLNCGFGMVEIATLTIGDLHLLQAHSPRHCEILNFQSTNQHSFIKRVRRKNGVYGEFLLFSQTVEAIQWMLKTRYRQPNPTPKDRPKNNFGFSVISISHGSERVVEFGKKGIEPHRHLFEEVVRCFSPLGVEFAGRFHDHAESAAGGRAGDEALGDVEALEHHAFETTRDMAEHAMLDRIVLRTARRVMGHLDVASSGRRPGP